MDETPLHNETAEHTSTRLSQLKARAVAHAFPNALIIGSDQVALLDGVQLGKPLTHVNAVRQLQSMRNQTVTFYSALTLLNARDQTEQTEVIPTRVSFRNFSDQEIENYLQKDQPYHCAGSAKAEGLGIALIEKIHSNDPNALIGLPLIRLIAMLNKVGFRVL